MTDDEYRLTPIDDEEFKLVPIDDEEEMKIAPDFPFDTDLRLIPVVCSACKVRMYATEDQVGMWKVCPDCLRKTEIRYVEPEFRYTVVLDENGGYIVNKPEIESAPKAKIGIDYRTVDGYQKPAFIPQRAFDDQQPIIEAFLQNMLESNEEKERKQKELDFEKKVEEEMRLAKKKKDAGFEADPLAKLLAEKETAAKIRMERIDNKAVPQPQAKPGIPQPPPYKDQNAAAGIPVPPVKNRSQNKNLPRETPVDSRDNYDDYDEATPFWPGFADFFNPFFAKSNLKKLTMLFVFGFLANFLLEHAKSLFGQAILDTHPDGPGHIMSWGEMGSFTGTFIFGGFFGIVAFALVLLFGISMYTETAHGKIKVNRWNVLDVQTAFSYFLWTAFFLWASFYPGVFLIWGTDTIFPAFGEPEYAYYRLSIFFMSPIFTFPILFVSVTETETFFGGWPRKTFMSMVLRPGTWVLFYFCVITVFLIPFAFFAALAYLNLFHNDHPLLQSYMYYIVAAALETVLYCFFPLLYFRFLGRLAWVISADMPNTEP